MTELSRGIWNLDAAHSEVGFWVRHTDVSKTRGVFSEVQAKIDVAEDVSASKVSANIKINSLNTRNSDRDGHLLSPDFFDAEQYPEMTFESTSFNLNGQDLEVVGNLTIKDQTHEVVLSGEYGGVVADPFGTTRFGASVSTQISRKEFGITWNAALEAGGVLVGDKVTINLDVEFVAPAA